MSESEGCWCSDSMSGGIPCPPGKCPNAPVRQAEVTLTVVSSLTDYLQIQVRRRAGEPGPIRLATIRVAREDVMGLLGGRVTLCEFETEAGK